MGLTNPQPGPSPIVTNPELPPLDPGFIENVKYVLRSEGVPTRVTVAAEVIKKTTHLSPKNLDRLLREGVREALVRAFPPDIESNDTEEEMKDFVLSESVARKLTETFVDSEVMQTAI